jgi:hypothetical protein
MHLHGVPEALALGGLVRGAAPVAVRQHTGAGRLALALAPAQQWRDGGLAGQVHQRIHGAQLRQAPTQSPELPAAQRASLRPHGGGGGV